MLSKDFYDELSQSYAKISKERLAYNKAVDLYIIDHPNFARFHSILDIGSGDGSRISKLFSKSATITAVEESPRMCQILRSIDGINHVIESSVGALNSHNFDNSFDLIIMQWNVLGHVDDHVPLVMFCYKALKPGGQLIFDVNNPLNIKHYGFYSFIKNILYFFIYPRRKRKYFPWKFANLETDVSFSPSSYYVDLLRTVGFTKITLTYFDYFTGEIAGPFTGQATFDTFKI